MEPSSDTMRIAITADAARAMGDLSRRRLFGIAGSAALAAFLAACGDDSGEPATTGGSSETDGSSAPGGSDSGASSFRLFTWAEYDDPDLMAKFGSIEITVFNSNEEAIQKLAASGDDLGYDMVCPTGVYVPQMAGEGLLEELDLAKITNFKNLNTAYTNQDWDQGNKYSVCKNWGTTGWIYDKTVITRELATWGDFIDAAQNEASGSVSILDTPVNLCGMFFWANGMDWNTTDPDELKQCEEFLVNEFAQHIKAFDSYPGINLTQGNYVLSMVWNGDARQGLNAVVEAGGNPDDYAWAIGAPETELWMDNWCILKGAKNLDACYNFLNFILDPANSAVDIEYHGYNTGIDAAIESLPEDLAFKDMIFFTDDEISRMRPGSLDNQEQVLAIYNSVKAAAGG
jgi:spermidine/putrescine transport system substrate-binding protein